MAAIADNTILTFLLYLNAAFPHFYRLATCSDGNYSGLEFSLLGYFKTMNSVSLIAVGLFLSFDSLYISRSWSVSSKLLSLCKFFLKKTLFCPCFHYQKTVTEEIFVLHLSVYTSFYTSTPR